VSFTYNAFFPANALQANDFMTVPPVGVYIVAGCGADLLINIALCFLGVLPAHVHAFYLEYVYYNRKEQASEGYYENRPAPGVYSSNVQTGGQGYGTMGPTR
jgi:uncharacterized membrane protein YqaE (UPF0057 family)